MRIIGNDPSVPRQTQEVASGTLPNGKAVIVNANGTVSVIGGASQAIGSETVYESNGRANFPSAAYDTNAQRVVIAYREEGSPDYGTAVVGTVSGTTLSFGTPVVFHSDRTRYTSTVYDANAQKIVIAYQDENDGNKGTAIVGTVSGTSISFGTPVVFDNDNAYIKTAYDANAQKIVIAYRDGSNSDYGGAIVGTVSGTSISFGSVSAYTSSAIFQQDMVYDSTAQKVVITYRDHGDSNKGKAVVGTVSGTSISFGSSAIFASGGTDRIATAYDVSANKTVVYFGDIGNSYYGTAIVGTVSGTSISFGTAQVFESVEIREPGATYDINASKTVIVYRDQGNGERGTIIAAKVSGTSLVFDTEFVIAQNPRIMAPTYDSDQNTVVTAYYDENANQGKAQASQIASTNLTSENYIGISRSGAADTKGAIIDTQGAIADNLSGLTAGQSYYVQTDGTLSTTAGSPSVFAGTAVSATKLIVKG